MEPIINDIVESTKYFMKDNFTSLFYKKPPKYSIKNLERKLDRFFRREKRFFKNKLLLYYNFNKNFFEIPAIPYYIYLFYSNLKYIVFSAINSDFDEILEIYREVVKKNPNYKNSRISDKKPAYDRRYVLIITYYIFLTFIYILSHVLYTYISNAFHYIIDILNVSNDENATFVLFILYTYLLIGFYYGGIPFIIRTTILIAKFTYFALTVLYYIIYYVLYILYIIFKALGTVGYNTGKSIVGGGNTKKKHNKTLYGGNIFDDFDDYMNDLKKTFDKLTIEFIVTIFNNSLNYITPDAETAVSVLEGQCRSTSNIERMIASHNNTRNSNVPVNINKKVNDQIKDLLPEDLQNNEFVKCMYKEKPKEPPKCNE